MGGDVGDVCGGVVEHGEDLVTDGMSDHERGATEKLEDRKVDTKV